MNNDSITMYTILIIGWPTLIVMSILIIRKGLSFQKKLKGTVIGTLAAPVIFGWLSMMYLLGFVSTSYMFGFDWQFTVIPAFLVFLVSITTSYKATVKAEKKANELQTFYENLENLVFKRTSLLEESHKKTLIREKEIQKLKDQFVYVMANKLKTPISIIEWNVDEALDKGRDKICLEMRTYLENIKVSNNNLSNLINDLTNTAYIDAGKAKIQKVEFDLQKLLENLVSKMEKVCKEKNIEISLGGDGKSCIIFSDKNGIATVVSNLLSNACKYNRNGGCIWVETEVGKDKVRVSVTDTGIGIAKKDQDDLFKKFKRIENSETRDIEGTGLGLYLCKKIVENLGGTIGVESEYQKGSTFWIEIPIKLELQKTKN